jgi:hypothetical protein
MRKAGQGALVLLSCTCNPSWLCIGYKTNTSTSAAYQAFSNAPQPWPDRNKFLQPFPRFFYIPLGPRLTYIAGLRFFGGVLLVTARFYLSMWWKRSADTVSNFYRGVPGLFRLLSHLYCLLRVFQVHCGSLGTCQPAYFLAERNAVLRCCHNGWI